MSDQKETGHLALYRKYRPDSFKDVLGQEEIVQSLKGALKQGAVSHAYLFYGSRGTGKTSVARIFARELGTSPNDLYEIDAASNTGVDDIRNLNESVNTLPFESKYKVYILDEAHMLSKSAFNALLKTLEEPPKHVIFILATTELSKLPETVVSRCQVFSFKKPSQKILKDVVLNISKKEGYTLESSSADLIALLGEGSFRDTQGILEKIISASGDKKISVSEVEVITGAPKGELVNAFIGAVEEGNVEAGMKAVKKATDNNIDMKVFLKLVLRKLRFVLLLKYAPDMETVIKNELSEADHFFLKELSKKTNLGISSATLLEFLNVHDWVGHTTIAELPIELALIKLAETKKGNNTADKAQKSNS